MKTKTHFLKGKVQVNKDKGNILVIASDETLDRHGDVLPIEYWDLSKFLLAPRMLVDHNHEVSSIVGKWLNARIEGGKLLIEALFHDITDLAVEVKEMVLQDFLDTVSVGFIYHEPEEDGGRPRFELIEVSWVTVPANPQARVVKSLLEKGISDEQKTKIKEFDGEIESDDVLPEEDEEPLNDDEIEKPADEVEKPIVDDEVETGDEVKQLFTPEFIEAQKYFVIRSSEDVKEWSATHSKETVGLFEMSYILKLLEAGEQLKTLTEEVEEMRKADEHAKLTRMALKEAAGIISHTLREVNRAGV